MTRMSFISVLALAGLSSISAAQGNFNFQPINLQDGFNASSVNNSGAILGSYSGGSAIWTSQTGLTQVVTQTGDAYLQTISNSGRVYGSSNGSIIQFDVVGGRQTVVSDSNINFSIVSSNSQDSLLLRGVSGSTTNYYIYGNGSLHQINMPGGTFTPNSILSDGTVVGLVPGGQSLGGNQGYNLARLNADGTTSVLPHTALNYSDSGPYQSTSLVQSYGLLGDGASYVQSSFTSSGGGTSETDITYQVFRADGSSYQTLATYANSHIGSYTSGFAPTVILNDGTMIGNNLQPTPGLAVYSFNHQSGAILDSSFVVTGSAIPESILFGTADGTMVGYSTVDGHGQYYLSGVNTVPEPASMAALGLGALALLRRRKK